jgi:hypothetical protein
MPLGVSRLASAYSTARRRSKPGRPSLNRDPKAPGVAAGVPVRRGPAGMKTGSAVMRGSGSVTGGAKGRGAAPKAGMASKSKYKAMV